jgi:hypothetical protein
MDEELETLRVPWMISPSMPLLRLCVGEDEIEDSVSFRAYFRGRSNLVSTPRVDPAGPFPQHVKEPDYGMVRFTFPKGVWARYKYGRDSDQDFGRSFDPSCSRESLDQQWLTSGCCPHPRAYLVRRSAWMRELGVGEERYVHLVFDGHEGYVEVVARGWAWAELRSDP